MAGYHEHTHQKRSFMNRAERATGEMSCKFCGKTFNRRFNLKRHESDYCPLRHENSDTDDDSHDMKSDDDDISTASNSKHTQSCEADGSEWK